MNIEHAYYEATGKYEPFEGVVLVDTFQTAEKSQAEFTFFNEKNSQRVERQKKAPIRVIIGNPPYNAWQQDENDNNKNRKYPELDRRVRVTYSDDSTATLKSSLSDPYIKAIRWASDRIGESGIVCFVTNDGYVEGIAADGMRKHLADDFDAVYVLDLGGNVRKNPKLSGTTHNVFGIQVGVSINLFVRRPLAKAAKRCAKIHYYAVVGDWRKEQKYKFLEKTESIAGLKWSKVSPDKRGNWFGSSTDDEFETYLPIGTKEGRNVDGDWLFRSFSTGLMSQRDSVVYNFKANAVYENVRQFAAAYNSEVRRYLESGNPKDVDAFVDNERLKWSRNLKRYLARGSKIEVDRGRIREAMFRPFCKRFLYFGPVINDERGSLERFLPLAECEKKNRLLWIKVGAEIPFYCLSINRIPDRLPQCGSQCFPLFTYSEDGKERRDNITPKALTLFQIFYDDDGITRADIFHYVYALLHHPAYRTRYAENLKRELPRIPFVGVWRASSQAGSSVASPHQGQFFPLASVEKMQGDAKPDHNPKASAKLFHAFAAAGKKLADLHVNYESAKEFPLQRHENKAVKLDWRVEAMKLSKDKASLFYNDFLTLSGIQAEVYDYRLGNRSALEWVIDQYRVTKDHNGNITSDPNRLDDEQYIVRLLGQVITVSLETMKVVQGLPALNFEEK